LNAPQTKGRKVTRNFRKGLSSYTDDASTKPCLNLGGFFFLKKSRERLIGLLNWEGRERSREHLIEKKGSSTLKGKSALPYSAGPMSHESWTTPDPHGRGSARPLSQEKEE